MLNIFTDNWDELPTLNEGERLVRIITDNSCDELYTIIDDSTDEDDIAFALRRKCGQYVQYEGYEDQTFLYERIEAANKATDDAWNGESWYTILWSDSGEYGEVRWYDTKDDLFDDLYSAFEESTETHLPFAVMLTEFDEDDLNEYLGYLDGDFDIEAILEDTTMVINGKRWTDTFGEDFDEAVRRHEL